jgi:HPt (histidine-containing phosphotransfer) domain-containing protein
MGEPEKHKESDKDREFYRPINPSQMRRDLVKLFIKTVDRKKSDILSALEVKNENMLRGIMHELKGSGSTIGYPRLTLLGEHLERKIKPKMNETEWREVEIFTMEVLSILDLILDENS